MNNTFVPEKSVISYGSSLPDQELISAAFPSEFIIKFWTAFMEMSRLRRVMDRVGFFCVTITGGVTKYSSDRTPLRQLDDKRIYS